jgi:hypothetical protein
MTEGHGPGCASVKSTVFLCYFFQSTILIFFGQISFSFLFKLIQRKVCLENRKVIDIIPKSIKFMNFKSFFHCK